MENLLNGSLTEGLSTMLTSMIKSVPSFLLALTIIIVGVIISKIIAKIVAKLLSKVGVDKLGDRLNSIEIVEKILLFPSIYFYHRSYGCTQHDGYIRFSDERI